MVCSCKYRSGHVMDKVKACAVKANGVNAACAGATNAAQCDAATSSGNGGDSNNDCEFTATSSAEY